ncbi:MAG TPA: tetratricopeptide repeat protein, partial [Thermomicrobiales bacterium]|nr:tetratricopeptide repeat protein [Thermomicrobiales bacterium]
TVPSPTSGVMAALISTLLALASFRVGNRTSSEGVSPSLLSPLSLYTGLKGLVIELSTINEYVLLAVGLLFLLLAVAVGVARWQAIRREEMRRRADQKPFAGWLINQRTVAFLAILALLVLGSYAYQQYLWRVALPIPDGALGIALTREASAATVEEGLADSLYTQGQAEQVVVRELPVVFDARDTDKARSLGHRIGARAVIIYRADEHAPAGQPRHIAYLVFTDPSIGLTITGAPAGPAASAATSPPVVVKEGVPVPVLQTETLDELINAAAGIIAYDDNRARKAIEHLTLAVPASPDAPNTGIINFYLGNAYNLDNQPDLAATAYEQAAAFFERRMQAGEILGPQDQLILVKAYLERGWLASMAEDWTGALAWYEKGLGPRSDVLARMEGLERPSDVPATYARLYTLMADAYRFQGLAEDQRAWEKRAAEETAAIAPLADANDAYALVQEGAAQVFLGDCLGASQSLEKALALDPTDIRALNNAGIVALLQERPDLAVGYVSRVAQPYPNDVSSRLLIGNLLILRALTSSYVEPAYLAEAEGYYREVIAIDPTNLAAHNGLASIATMRAQGSILDETALLVDDPLAIAKSQNLWPLDVERRQATLDAFALVIDERRVVASELQPDDPEAQIAVAEAYLERLKLQYSVLLSMKLSKTDNPDMDTMGEQVIADAGQVREWAGRVLDSPSATRLQKLRAYAALSETTEREWGWYALFAEDPAKTEEVEHEHRRIVADGIAFGEAEPIGHLDEISPLRILYFKAVFIASAWDQDSEAAAELYSRIDAITQQEQAGRTKGITHYSTFCTEVRDSQEGDAELAGGDAKAAQAHYEAAITANPHHVNALLGLAATRYALGDIDGAVEGASAATALDAPDPTRWADLGRYNLAAGDAAAAKDAYGRFLQQASGLPPQARMAVVGAAIERLRELLEEDPDRASLIAGVVPVFAGELDGMSTDASHTYQLPALATSLGRLALYADDATDAEPLFRQALELDPLQPDAHADLVIATLAEDREATAEIDAAFASLADPAWSRVAGYEDPDVLLDIMEREATAYVDRFPDREATIEPFTSRLPAERKSQDWRVRGVTGTTYTSANFGYTVTWDDTWTVSEASTDPMTRLDALQLTNGVSTVHISAASMDVTDASACLDASLERVRAEGAWANVTPATDEAGGEVAGETGDSAYVAFVEQGDAGSSGAFVDYIDCRPLGTPGTFASVIALVPAVVYDQQAAMVNQLFAGFASSAGTPGAELPAALPDIDLHGVIAEVPDVTGNVYTSPTYGYRLPVVAPWAVVTTSSEDGVDTVHLTDGGDDVFLEWSADGADDPNACVGEIAKNLSKDESFTDLSPFNGPDGEPLRGHDGDRAFAAFTFRSKDADASSPDTVFYVECRALDGDTMLLVLHLSTPARVARIATARDTLLSGLTSGEPVSRGPEPATPEPVGTPAGLLDGHPFFATRCATSS